MSTVAKPPLRLFAFALLCSAISACKAPGERHDSPAAAVSISAKQLSALSDGDLIFQESTSRQADMVRALTRSQWTHVGVLFLDASGPAVLEAATPVRKTPLAQWISRGRRQHYVVKRLRDAETRLDAAALERMSALGESFLGRPYDLRFRWDDDTLYCSELAHKLFERAADVKIGRLQRAADMNLSDPSVRRALKTRYAGLELSPDETVITPDSIFNDKQLVEVSMSSIVAQ